MKAEVIHVQWYAERSVKGGSFFIRERLIDIRDACAAICQGRCRREAGS